MGLFAILIVFSRYSSASIHSPRRRLERVGAASSRKNYLHMSYSISHISDLISARRIGNTHADIECLLTDSRSLVFPETTLFFALRTGTGDGHRYIDDLYRRGVHNFVVGTLPDDAQAHYPSANFLLVASPLQALQTLTEQHRLQFDIPVVGITGSNGKTIVKEWIYQLLSPSETVTRSPRSYNSQIGVPLSVWLLNEHSRVGLFEAGISRPGEMSALRHIIRPTLGVLTNIGAAHEANFATPDEKCLEKLKLFKHTPALIYCVDNPLIDRCLDALGYTGQRIGWSRRSPQAAFYAEVVPATGQPETIGETAVTHSGKTKIRLHDRDGQRIVAFEIPFDDEASIENAIHTAIVGLQLQLTPTQIGERMPHLDPVAMRLEVKQGVRGLTLIDDAYNSDLTSLDIALDFLARRKEPHHRSILVLSDFQQSGIAPDVLYHRVAALLAPRQVDMLIGVGSDVRQLDGLVKSETHFFDTTDALLESGLLDTLSHDVILLKGARAFAFEQLTDELLLKVHETTLEVNLGALADNLRFYRSFMRPETKITCMIKAGAYGCGSVEVARTLQDLGVDYLAVAVADEGVELRKAGITAGILIMNPEMSALHTLFKYRLEPEVYNFRLLDALIRAARREGITQYPVHIKFDTGMCRLGFNPDVDVPELIDVLRRQQALRPRSVFSHFVGSDSPDFDEFSARQFTIFDRASRELQAAFPYHILRHICNSSGIERFPERHLDMCRLGLGLYGIDPIDNRSLENVASLRTTILQIRDVAAGTSVGYSRRSIVDRPSRIAAIPIGYADGLNRRLGNRHGYCLVNGRRAPYVGNICMDVCMIDVTDIPCREGDRVEIFGDELPAATLAQQLDTIPYEVLTSVSQRVKRVFFQ